MPTAEIVEAHDCAELNETELEAIANRATQLTYNTMPVILGLCKLGSDS